MAARTFELPTSARMPPLATARVLALAWLVRAARGAGDLLGGAVLVPAGASVAAAVAQSRARPAHAVLLGAGTHRLRAPLALGAADSGLLLRGVAGAVIDGGVVLGAFTVGAGGEWRAALPAALFNASAANWPAALYINGSARLRARAPNAAGAGPPWSFAARYGAGAVFEGARPLLPCSLPAFGACPAEDLTGFFMNASDPEQARALVALAAASGAGAGAGTGALVHVVQAWSMAWSRVAAADAASGRVNFSEAASTAVGAFGFAPGSTPSGGRFVLENLRAFLDAPGEFFVDEAAGELLYLPLPGESPDAAEAVVPLLATLLTIAGDGAAHPAEHISVSDIAFAHFGEAPGARARLAPMSPTSAINVGPHAANVSVLSVAVRNGGGNGVALWPDTRGALLDRLNISDLGGRGVTGMVQTGLSDLSNFSGVVLSNSSVARVAGVYLDEAACGVSAVGGMRVLHNDVGFTPWSPLHAVFAGGGPAPPPTPFPVGAPTVEFAFNVAHDYGLGVLSDMGGVYVDVFPKGNASASWLRASVHDNLVTRGAVYVGGYGANGLYNDDGTSGATWERNVVAHVGGHGASAHCGVNTTLRNNLFVVIATQNFTKDAGLWGALSGCDGVAAAGVGAALNVELNIFDLVPGAPAAYPPKYAWLAPPHLRLASNRNVYFVAGGAEAVQFPNGTHATVGLAGWRAATGLDAASVEADPRVADDLSVAPGSPAWALGWSRIDITSMGPVPEASGR